MVPVAGLRLHVTAALAPFVTLAVNCCICEGERVAVKGVTLTVTGPSRASLCRASPAAVSSAPSTATRPCSHSRKLAESGRDLLFGRPAKGSNTQRFPRLERTRRTFAGFSILLGIDSAAVRMEIHTPGSQGTSQQVRSTGPQQDGSSRPKIIRRRIYEMEDLASSAKFRDRNVALLRPMEI